MAATASICDFGWKAADFTLPGTDGAAHSLADCAGENGLVVAFICNHCPYVVASIPRIVSDATLLRAAGVGFVAICSNDEVAYPQDSFKNMKVFADQHQFTFPYLQDRDQSIARTYDAVCTPDFFGFNGQLGLQYRGRLDAAKVEAAAPGLRRDLLEAMTEVARGGDGPATQIPSIGCSITWK
jgi:peroxiredoxin